MCRPFVCVVLLLFVQPVAPLQAQRPPAKSPVAPSLEATVQEAKFIFHGKVEKLKASNVKMLEPSERTAVVRVIEVLEAPKTLPDSTGKEITVELKKTTVLKAGEEAIFFTKSLLYGENIAVLEVAHQGVEKPAAALRKEIAEARRMIEDRALEKRLADSSLVVMGRVSLIRMVTDESLRGPITEHSPEWAEAVIQVESFERGRLATNNVTVLFPSSRDVMWAQAPKFREGQSGIWLLRKQKIEGTAAKVQEYYTALDPADFQPAEQLNRIRSLIPSIQ